MSEPSAWIDTAARAINADSPWLGLKPFTEATQRFFFGRDAELREMYLRVRDTPLTVFYGQSGLGKTSLLGAGLVPKLKAEGYKPVLLRLLFGTDDPPLLDQIRAALATACASEEWPADALLTMWGQVGLWEIFHRSDFWPKGSADLLGTNPPVLILDQFEELFTLGRELRSKNELRTLGMDLADQAENRLPESLRERMRDNPLVSDHIHFNPSPVRLVLTLREDYLSQLEEWKSFFPSLMRNRMALHLLRGPQALEAVVRPARLDGRNLVDDSVAKEIVRRIAGATENTPMEDIEAVPPLLSLLCDELNRERGDEPTISLHLVQERHTNILQAFYERSFTDWPPPLRRLVEDRLVTVAGHRNSIAWEDAEAELRQAGFEEPQAALKALVTCRLLSIEERGRHQRLELTHDVLTPLVVESRDKRQERERTAKAEAERQAALELAAQERQQRQRWRRLTAVAVIALLLACGMTGWAFLSRKAALKAEKKAKVAQSLAMLQRAFNLIENDRGGEALAVLTAILRLQPENKEAQDRMMSLLAQRNFLVPLQIFQQDRPYSFKFSPDGTRILTISQDCVRVLDTRTGLPLTKPLSQRKEDWVRFVTFSPDGSRILTVLGDHTGIIWDAQTGQRLTEELNLDLGSPSTAAISSDNSLILTNHNPVCVWDAQTGQSLFKTLGRHEDWISHIVFSPDNSRILTASWDKTARVWDARTGRPLTVPLRHTEIINSAVFSPDGTRILTASQDHTARVWNTRTGQPLLEPLMHEDKVISAVFSPDGTRILTASWDNTARVWDSRTGHPLTVPLRHNAFVNSAVFSPDGTRILTASQDHTARVWDTGSGQPLCEPLMHEGSVLSAIFSSDNSRILTTSWDNTARVWNANTGLPIKKVLKFEILVKSAVFSPDGARIFTTSQDNTARVWDSRTGLPLTAPIRHNKPVKSTVFSPDGARILTVSQDNNVRVLDTHSAQILCEFLPKQEGAIESAVFSPDGARILTVKWDESILVWDAYTGQPLIQPLMKDGSKIIGYSPDGYRAVSSYRDNSARIFYARIWDTRTGQPLTAPLKHSDNVESAVFSPDSLHIVTKIWDAAQIWDARTGLPLTEPLKHDQNISTAVFSPDSSRILTTSWDHTVRVYDARNGQLFSIPISNERKIESADFSSDGTRILTVSEDKAIRVWDTLSGQPLTDPLKHEQKVTSALFSPDGSRILTISGNTTAINNWKQGAARVWDLGLNLPPAPSWFLDLIEALAGRVLNHYLSTTPIKNPPDEIQTIKNQFLVPGNPNDPYVQHAKRLLHMEQE